MGEKVKKVTHKNFTLVELLAAMAVFSILLILSIRLFTGAQNLWLRSEQKTDVFASARTAMEFVASHIQTLLYSADEPFGIIDSTEDNEYEGEKDSIFFVSTIRHSGNYDRYFCRFFLVDPDPADTASEYEKLNAGTLQMMSYTGGSKSFYQLFPPYRPDIRNRVFKSRTEALSELYGPFIDSSFEDSSAAKFKRLETMSDSAVEAEDGIDRVGIVENVVSFKLTRYIADTAGQKLDPDKKDGDTDVAPYLLEIELKIMDSRESFKKWQDPPAGISKDDIFAENGYTFRRAVLLGKKGNR